MSTVQPARLNGKVATCLSYAPKSAGKQFTTKRALQQIRRCVRDLERREST